DRDLEVAAHPHRELTESVTLGERAQRAKRRARILWTLDGGRNRHESAHLQMRHATDRVEGRRHRVGSEAALARLVADVDLEQHVDGAAGARGAALALARDVETVDRLDDVEERERVLDLVR